MSLTLAKYSSNARLSEETTAFAANLQHNGKTVATCENHGTGGNTNVWLNALGQSTRDSIVADARTLLAASPEWADLIDTTTTDLSLLECAVDELVGRREQEKEDKRIQSAFDRFTAKAVASGAKIVTRRATNSGWSMQSFSSDERFVTACDRLKPTDEAFVVMHRGA